MFLDRFACLKMTCLSFFLFCPLGPVKFNFSFTCLLQTGHTALQRAAAEGHLEIVKTLLENGISVDHQDEVVSDKNYEVFDANNISFVRNIMRGRF